MHFLDLADLRRAGCDWWLALLINPLSCLIRSIQISLVLLWVWIAVRLWSIMSSCIFLRLPTLVSRCYILVIYTLNPHWEHWVRSIFPGLLFKSRLLLLFAPIPIWYILATFIRLVWITRRLVVSRMLGWRSSGHCELRRLIAYSLSTLLTHRLHEVIPSRSFKRSRERTLLSLHRRGVHWSSTLDVWLVLLYECFCVR